MKAVKSKGIPVKEAGVSYASKAEPAPASGMVRTQIYLTPEEHQFVDSESRRKGIPMAAVIRDFIEEKMRVPDEAWAKFLAPVADDPDWDGPEDGSINHDHYVYGAPKRYIKKNGKWVETPELLDE
jgi:hypothetical protein